MKVKFSGKKLIGKNIYSFTFQSKKRVEYLPGQYVYITLPGILPTEGRGPTRQFTISSSPTETDIVITTRQNEKSSFKNKFMELVPDTEVEIDGPHGTFYFDEETTGNHVFLSGGLGVTACRSMTKYAVDKKLPVNLRLFYCVTTLEDAIFVDEFENWQKSVLQHEIIETEGKGAPNINGKDFINSDFWITGDPSFVTKMENMLLKQKIDRDKIHFEKFTGLA